MALIYIVLGMMLGGTISTIFLTAMQVGKNNR